MGIINNELILKMAEELYFSGNILGRKVFDKLTSNIFNIIVLKKG